MKSAILVGIVLVGFACVGLGATPRIPQTQSDHLGIKNEFVVVYQGDTPKNSNEMLHSENDGLPMTLVRTTRAKRSAGSENWQFARARFFSNGCSLYRSQRNGKRVRFLSDGHD